MIKLKVQKLTNVQLPNKAHKTDAGIDFYLPKDLNYIIQNGKNIKIETFTDNGIVKTAIAIHPNESALLPMGVKTEFDKDYALVFFNRSGTATKKHLLRGACVIDSAYRGELLLNLNNVSNEIQYLLAGEKVIQGLLLPVPEVEIIEETVNENTDRGEGGFGSTDKK